jgi:hypothetical protein
MVGGSDLKYIDPGDMKPGIRTRGDSPVMRSFMGGLVCGNRPESHAIL